MPLSPKDEAECVTFLRRSVLLKACTDDQRKNLCKQAEKKKYIKGEYLQKEGEPQKSVFVLSQGEVTREKDVNGERHQIDTYMGGNTVGSLHVMNKDPAYASTKANSDVVAYEIKSEPIVQYFKSNPDFAYNVAYGLALEVRRHTRFQRTPLLEQPAKTTPIFAVSIAAGIESFYRAAMNAILNQQLTGVRKGSLFPNMHIQIPTRIFYINGFKGIRLFLDSKMKEYQVDHMEIGKQIRLLAAITPGIVMSPASSLLEASNAGHSNPEPMYKRWTRGLVPRIGREVIFGVGLNQLSDYCEERVPHVIESLALRNAFGSLSAGIICGYMSHVVHNMSTLKLMNPNKTYAEHMKEYIKKAESRVPSGVPDSLKGPASVATALIFPTGVLIRTTQIVGSFIILNGTISAINRYFYPSPKPKA